MSKKRTKETVPSFAKGRKSSISVLDGLVKALWFQPSPAGPSWPAKSFLQLTNEVSGLIGYQVPTTTIRSIIYRRSSLFEKVMQQGTLLWRLSDSVRQDS